MTADRRQAEAMLELALQVRHDTLALLEAARRVAGWHVRDLPEVAEVSAILPILDRVAVASRERLEAAGRIADRAAELERSGG